MHNRCAVVAVLAAAASTSVALAGYDEVITFNEVPLGTLVDGLTIKNVGFTVTGQPDRGSAAIGSGPGLTPFVSAPMIEGPALSTLGLHFAQPVDAFGFGFAVSVGGAVPNAVIVDVFDPDGAFLGTFTADGKAGNRGEYFFSSGLLAVAGLGPIGSASINFADYAPTVQGLSQGIPIVRFGLDNLGYDFSAVTVPLPTSGLLSAAGLLGLASRRRRRLI